MLLSGTDIASSIKEHLQKQVKILAGRSVIPTLAIIHLSDDARSFSYIRQKMKVAGEIGAAVRVFGKADIKDAKQLKSTIERLNADVGVHGIIIQRPVPALFDIPDILLSVKKEKDVDGFRKDSPFIPPVASAVEKILKTMFGNEQSDVDFTDLLRTKTIAVVGKGETAGRPIRAYFDERRIPIQGIDSKTIHPETLLRNSDIIISCVGKEHIISKDRIKKGCILIAVGIYQDDEGKLHGDYDEEEVKDIASYYTPTPGGVGPVNVACLFKNLLSAAQ